jgi:hypothetical protein
MTTEQDVKAAVRSYISDVYPDGPVPKSAAVVINFGHVGCETLIIIPDDSFDAQHPDASLPAPVQTLLPKTV